MFLNNANFSRPNRFFWRLNVVNKNLSMVRCQRRMTEVNRAFRSQQPDSPDKCRHCNGARPEQQQYGSCHRESQLRLQSHSWRETPLSLSRFCQYCSRLFRQRCVAGTYWAVRVIVRLRSINVMVLIRLLALFLH